MSVQLDNHGRCIKCGMRVGTTAGHYCPQANWSKEGLSFCDECGKPVDISKLHVSIPRAGQVQVNKVLHAECFYANYEDIKGQA